MGMKATRKGRWQHLVIKASAGSGKTFRLSNRFLELTAAGEPADTILATTFTRAAAAEIQDRVLVRLAKAALDDGEREKLSGFLQAGRGGAPPLTRARCLDLLADMTRNLHRLRIGTLDSFFIQIARSFAWELGLPAHWRIVDEFEDMRIRDEAIAALVASEDRESLTRLVQWLTKGEAQRSLGDLLDETVKGLYELYREASAEAWNKIPKPKGLDPAALEACVAALERTPLPSHKSIQKAHQNDLEIVRRGDWETLPTRGIGAKVLAGEEVYYGKTLDPATLEVYSSLLQHASAVFLGKVATQTAATHELLDRYREQYERLKRQAGGLRFSDVTYLVGAWFAAHEKSERATAAATLPAVSLDQVAFRLDAHLNHLLLDEFQDTSLAQWNVLRPLAQRITSAADGTSFFCVGDGKQAIYGWRGGSAEIFEALDQQLNGLQHDPLNESRRSAQVIIDAVNQIFQGMTRHARLERCEEGVRQWCSAFPPHTTALSDMPGHVTLEAGPAADEESEDDEPLLTHAAVRIQQLAAAAPGRSIGVLVRSNTAIAELIFRLRKLGVAASEEGGNPLTDSAAVELIMSALEFADHPGHSTARFHIAHSPLAAVFDIRPVGGSPSRDAAAARNLRAQLLADGYGPSIERWTKMLLDACDARDRRRLAQLVARAYEHDAQATLRPRDFVEAVRIERAPDPSSDDVRVTTVHKSKGLQYDIVVLPDLATPLLGQPDGYVAGRSTPMGPAEIVCRHVNQDLRPLLPPKLQHLFEQQDRQDTFESLCVLYVALTRAVHALHMIVPATAGGEKSGLPRTYAGLIRAALTDGTPLEPLATAYEAGDARWYRARETAGAPPPSPVPAAPLELRLAPLDGPPRRGLERVAPSELEGGKRVRWTSAAASEGLLGRQRGTLLHAWFERIRWLSEGTPDDDELRTIANQVLEAQITPTQWEAWLAAFRESLAKPEVAAVLSPEYYRDWRAIGVELTGAATLEVYNERRFAIRQGDQLVSGTFDRLVVARVGGQAAAVDIVDYKTDALDPGDAQAKAEKVEYYRPQLAAYRAAAGQLFGLEPRCIGTRLVLLSLGQVVRVDG
ncbi:MAG: UvrD-helicase domain-containing protein [Pirellulales bacterium]